MSSQGPKGAARRAAVLQAAAKVLATHGAQDFSLRRVAQTAGIRLGNLQYYFPTRADLVAALLAGHLAAGLARVDSVADDPAAMMAQLSSDHQDVELVASFLAIWELAAHDGEIAAAVRAFYEQYARIVADRILARLPQVPPRTALARARVVVALLEGAAVLRGGIGGVSDADTDAELVRTALVLLGGVPG